MNKQLTRRRRAARRATARTLAVAAALAALVATLGAGQALAGPDERVLERQARIDNQAAASQADKQGKAEEPSQGSPTQPPRRFFQPEPPMDTGPRLDADEQVVPAPPPPPAERTGLAWSSGWRSPPCSWRLSPPRPGGSTTAVPDLSRPPERPAGPPARSAGRGRRPTRRPRPRLTKAKRWCG